MADIRVIVAPYELDRLRSGTGRGPEELLAGGALAALAVGGASVTSETLEIGSEFHQTGVGEIDACFALIARTAEAVRGARAAGAFPVILSGSCFMSIGVVAGIDEERPSVLWLDAHGDFNEPATTESGYFDGMGLAVLTGDAWQAMHASVPGARAVPHASVVLAGARSLDPPEEARLAACAVTLLTVDELRDPATLVAAVPRDTTGVYLHLDLDVLDEQVNVYSAPDGLSAAELDANVAAVLGAAPVRAITLSAYDPSADRDIRVVPAALRVLETIGRHVASGS